VDHFCRFHLWRTNLEQVQIHLLVEGTRRGLRDFILHCGTKNERTEIRTAVQKEFMVVATHVIANCETVKAPEIQLSLKRGKLALTKVPIKEAGGCVP
jgi:hypothetical protein